MGPWGFWYHSEKIANGSDNRGNWGLRDQLEAMKWVSMFIKFFGGNANDITLGGCSAGAQSVMAHLTQPMSWPYFHKALLLSPPTGIEYYTADEGRQIYEKVARRLKCDYSDLECLRKVSNEDIHEAGV